MPSKMWTVMNDLDVVTSKICSAREILDCAIDRLQEHQYDKVEQLMYAVDEFLQYYLAEFDEKFKLAWQETVVKQKKEEDDAQDAVNREKEYYEPTQYTDEELDAMCDAAEGDKLITHSEWHKREWEKSKIKESKSWILPVEEDGDDCVVTFPDELMAKTGWREGDVLEWIDNGDGSYILKKVTETLEMDQC